MEADAEHGPTAALYQKIVDVVIADACANADVDVALSALAYALREVARCAEIPMHVVIANVGRIVGAEVQVIPLGKEAHQA